jgi:hypothetical protein
LVVNETCFAEGEMHAREYNNGSRVGMTMGTEDVLAGEGIFIMVKRED